MGAEMNGIALHGNTRIYGGTFLVFSDYMRNAVRLSALMQLPVTYVWTHDSIGLGEDGPTHQPVEHLAVAARHPRPERRPPGRRQRDRDRLARDPQAPHRRPAGRPRTAWRSTRQGVPTYAPNEDAAKGGYVLVEAVRRRRREVILIATGSEVQLAVEAREQLRGRGHRRPGWCRCRAWSGSRSRTRRTGTACCRRPCKARVAVEAGIGLTWHRYVGDAGRIVSLEHFGASADGKVLFREFGFTAENVAAAARESLAAAAALTPTYDDDHGDASTMTTTALKRLSDEGVAIWLDDLSPRAASTSGNLAELIDDAARRRASPPTRRSSRRRSSARRRLRASSSPTSPPAGSTVDEAVRMITTARRPRRLRRAAPGLRRHRRPGRPGLHRGRPAPGARHRGDHRRGQAAVVAGRPARTCCIKIPATRAGLPAITEVHRPRASASTSR